MLSCVAIVFILFCSCLIQLYINSTYLISKEIADKKAIFETDYIYEYTPFGTTSKTTKLKNEPTVVFKENYPKLIGTSSVYPLYSSVFEALYENAEDKIQGYLEISADEYAYKRLTDKKIDVVFTFEPPSKYENIAKEKGVKLKFVPIAKDAFVFFVNSNNLVNDLSVKNIQDIYSGKVKNWSALGGKDSDILAFQQYEGRDSQTFMIVNVMKKIKMKKPLEEKYENDHGIMNLNADYRNADEAIGYTFRYYLTHELDKNDTKILNIDGIAPSVENIQNDTYPFIKTLYAVYVTDASENSKKLVDWITSMQGQDLIKDVGYVPILDVK